MRLTRRDFVTRVGAAGGSAAAYLSMQGLGLAAHSPAASGHFSLNGDSPPGTSVVILGAGLAGLTACYELQRAGYQCSVIEARDRIGGRTWTLRAGDTVTESEGESQLCRFEPGAYFNPGPARISSQHRALLAYCSKFDVALEVFVNQNRSAMFQDDRSFQGHSVSSRQLHHHGAGQVAELLAKAIDKSALDAELSANDQERLIYFLRNWGALDYDNRYRGSERSGYVTPPGAALQAGIIEQPFELGELLDSRFWHWQMTHEQRFDQQATMLQPVGGMDKISSAFSARVGHRVQTQCVVKALRKRDGGVRVIYHDLADDTQKAIEADHCICTLPLSLLSRVESDLSAPLKSHIRMCGYEPSCKLGWQATRRFWEEDESIYGGISWSADNITQLWYPASGFHSSHGVLVGAYNFGVQAIEFGRLSAKRRAEVARISGEKIHPQMNTEAVNPISVAWQHVPFSAGAFASWTESSRQRFYPLLTEPEDRFYLAGEHLSYLTGWQEGAVLAAQYAVGKLHEEVRARSNA